MAQVMPPWEREQMQHTIRYDHQQQKAKQEKQELIMTSKNRKCEQHITQLLEQNRNLRADNTTLRQKNTETDGENFQLRIAYNELKDLYLENLQKLHNLETSLPRQ